MFVNLTAILGYDSSRTRVMKKYNREFGIEVDTKIRLHVQEVDTRDRGIEFG